MLRVQSAQHNTISGCGGTGRRARVRGVWFSRMGSSPIIRTKKSRYTFVCLLFSFAEGT